MSGADLELVSALDVWASLIAKPVFSNKRRPLSLRVGDKGEVIATPNIREDHNPS